MIASPSDVADERRIVTEAIYRWNDANALARKMALLPVKWETNSSPDMAGPPQTILNRQILEEADILVGIFGTRIGTPTAEHVSGSVEEIKKHVGAGKTAMVYFSDVPVAPSSIDAAQYAALQAFRAECERTGLYATFDSLDEFRNKFSHHLDLELNKPRYLWLEAAQPTKGLDEWTPSPEEFEFIKALAASDDGIAVLQEGLGFSGLRAGPTEFMDGTNRLTAKWRAIVSNLQRRQVIERIDEGIYRLTSAGYELVDGEIARQDATTPTEISLKVVGTHAEPILYIRSNRTIVIGRLDFLLSSEACIATQELHGEGKELNAEIDYGKITAVFNSPRPDRNYSDWSGPAKVTPRI